MPRPKKHPDEKRDQRFNLRFTAAELAHVETQARLAGIGPHEFLRRRALGYVVPPASAQQRTDPGIVTELNRLGLELKAIGNNANQLALASHTNRRFATSWAGVVERIHELGGQVTAALERLVIRGS